MQQKGSSSIKTELSLSSQLSATCISYVFSLSIAITLWDKCCRPCLIDEESKAKREEVTCPGSQLVSGSFQFSSVAQSCPTLCNPMDYSTPGLPDHQPTPGNYPNSCPSSQWCHPTISSSVIPFTSCLQSFPASGSFQMSKFFASVAQVLEFQLQHQSFQWIFRTDFL